MEPKEYKLRSDICEIQVYDNGDICCARSPSNCPKTEEQDKGVFNHHCLVLRQ